jgi:hypothetical protein
VWDLAGAEILVKHCDALIPGQVAAKGFCSVDDEIAATLRAAGPGPQVVVKVSVRPADADVATRLAVARAALAEVAAARSSVGARPAS